MRLRDLLRKFKLLRDPSEELVLLREENSALKAIIEKMEAFEQEQQQLIEEIKAFDQERQEFIEELIADRNKFFKATQTDPLTGALSRRHLDEELPTYFHNQERNEKSLALLFIDLDNFKLVNDICGHLTGDELLARVTKIFQEVVRSTDAVIRYGGDEFVIIATNVSSRDTLRALSDRLHAGIASLRLEGCEVKVTLSIGICFVEKNEYNKLVLSPKEALERADLAVYRSKNGGRNQTNFA